ncbi:MAG TPA: exopolysaccharide biosynthesis protein, partial [Pirellulaceae bacterium]|nr:exopolysaccharide biosynthesis protein [Pirellulaceae bacterium]
TALHRRLSVLTKGPALIGIGVISILLAITFFPLALVPFGVFVPGLAITLLALGVTARDGLLVLLGYAGAIVAIVLMFVYWPF